MAESKMSERSRSFYRKCSVRELVGGEKIFLSIDTPESYSSFVTAARQDNRRDLQPQILSSAGRP